MRIFVGKKGDVIIADSSIKRHLGVAKHIVIVNSKEFGNANTLVERLRRFAPDIIARHLRIVKESSNVVFARLEGDEKVGERIECVDVAEDRYAVYRRCRRIVEYVFAGEKAEEEYTDVYFKPEAYEVVEEPGAEKLLNLLERAKAEIERYTSDGKMVINALRLVAITAGFESVARGECLPARRRLRREAAEAARARGFSVDQQELEGWKICADYPWLWRETAGELTPRLRRILELLGYLE